MKPKIYLDYDSTLNNLVDVWVGWINVAYEGGITTKDIEHWDWIEEKFGGGANDFWKSPKIYQYGIVRPIDGSQEFVKNLQNCHDVSIVTNSWPGTERSKDEHIKRHFGNIKVIHEAQKHKVTHDGILIDDRKETIISHCSKNKTYGILFNKNLEYGWSNFNIAEVVLLGGLVVMKKSYEDILDILGIMHL